MASELSFHQRHPIISGFFILGLLFILFLGTISLLFRSCTATLSDKGPLMTSGEAVIGVVEIKGMINSADEILKDLAALRENKRVKGIVVRIDSPGGAVGASQEIFKEIAYNNRKKPVVASMGSVAASGGYYAALGAQKIVASRGTLTGSIGVILKFPNLKELYEKIGYKSQIVKSGEMKDIGSTDRSLTEEERQLLNSLLENVHRQFIADVVRERNIPLEKAEKLSDGRIFSGEQALEVGLIDETGNFYDAVRLCAKMANMKTELPKLYYPDGEQIDIFKFFTRRSLEGILGFLKDKNPSLSSELTMNH